MHIFTLGDSLTPHGFKLSQALFNPAEASPHNGKKFSFELPDAVITFFDKNNYRNNFSSHSGSFILLLNFFNNQYH
jgi:hypothetical protein